VPLSRSSRALADAHRACRRIRISSCAILDVLTYDQHLDTSLLQQEDLQMFGRLIFSLCMGTANIGNTTNVSKALDAIGRQYSQDVKTVLLYLTSKPGPHKTIAHLFDMIAGRVVAEMDEAQGYVLAVRGFSVQ
jgi:PAB-dependent poly(A)-specific ribonuclease subunit 3